MTTRFRPLLIAALLASVFVFPSAPDAAPYHGRGAGDKGTMKMVPDVVPDMADPATQVDADLDIDMKAGAETDAPQSLFDAMRYAYDNSSSIRAARQELLAVQEGLPQAQAGYKPSASASAGINKSWVDGGNPGADGSTEKDLGASLSQPLYRGGRTVSGIKASKNTIMAQRAALNATESDVMLGVVTTYMNVLRDQTLLDLANNNRDVIAKQLDASQARFNVGDVTRTDVAQSQARLSDAESGVIAARGNLQSSIAVYRQVVGIPPGRLSMPKDVLPIPETLDESTAMAEKYNPSVIAAQFTRDAAQDNIDVVNGELLPEVDLVGGVNRAIDPSPGFVNNQTVKSIGLSATVPLYEAGSVRSRVRQAKDTASQRSIEVKRTEDAAREQTVSNWETFRSSQAEITSRKEEVKANAIARDGVHKEAELGTRTILDALNADQELLNSRSALVTARRDEVVARYALGAAIGLMNPNALGFPELSRDYNDHIREITHKIFSTGTDYQPVAAKAAEPAPKPAVNR